MLHTRYRERWSNNGRRSYRDLDEPVNKVPPTWAQQIPIKGLEKNNKGSKRLTKKLETRKKQQRPQRAKPDRTKPKLKSQA